MHDIWPFKRKSRSSLDRSVNVNTYLPNVCFTITLYDYFFGWNTLTLDLLISDLIVTFLSYEKTSFGPITKSIP